MAITSGVKYRYLKLNFELPVFNMPSWYCVYSPVGSNRFGTREQMTMGWTVVKIDEQGREEKKLSDELDIDGFDTLNVNKFKLIKYLDPYGDATFNSLQLDDLLTDLRELEKNGRLKTKLLTELTGLVSECKSEVHSYLKFFGD